MHGAAVVAKQNITSLEQRNHLAEIYFRQDNTAGFAERGTVTARVDEDQSAHSRFLTDESGRLAKPLEWPTLVSHACARVDSNKDIAR
jgi:hypothetical protein